MTDFGRLLVIGVAVLVLSPIAAQETEHQIGPEDIASWVNDADSIVVGTFRARWPVPLFDGWHYYSQIDVRDQLVPEGKTATLHIGWVRQYASCLICNDLRPLDGRSGIWFLRKRNATLQIFGGTTGWCSAPLDLRYLDQVRAAARGTWILGRISRGRWLS